MDRYIALVISFFISTAAVAETSTAVFYPRFSGFANNAFTKPATNLVQNYGVKVGYFWQSPDVGSLAMTSRMSSAEGAKLTSAITGVAPVNQVAAKALASNLLRIGALGALAVLGPWALESGLQYLGDAWKKRQSPASAVLRLPPNCTGALSSDYFCYDIPGPIPAPWDAAAIECVNLGGHVVATSGSTYGCKGDRALSTRPAVDDDFVQLQSSRSLSDAELKAMVDAGFAVPISKPAATVVGDFSAVSAADLAWLQNAGYFTKGDASHLDYSPPHFDERTNQWVQPTLSVRAVSNAGVEATLYDKVINPPVQNPDGTYTTTQKTDPVTNLPLTQETKQDECALNPDRVGCAKLDQPQGDQAPQPTNVAISNNPTPWGGDGVCPADIHVDFLGSDIPITYAPVCTFMSAMRPVVIGLAWITATLILIGAKGGNE